MACAQLIALKLPSTTITVAETVAAGAFVQPTPLLPFAQSPGYEKLPAFCRVAATISPVADSEIKFEVWLPAEGWNGKFMGTGNGQARGTIFYWNMADPLRRGYAVANTDRGHEGEGSDWRFAIGHPEKLIDYSYRAVHEMTVKSKAIIKAFYGSEAQHAYWSGCSAGGQQGLTAAQRFPDDYDGIIAGAGSGDWVSLTMKSIFIEQVMTDPKSPLPREKLPLIRNAAITACDAADGVADRVVEHPHNCSFDPGVLQCSKGDTSGCLTAAEVDAVRRIYRGPVNPRTGEIAAPGPSPGSELAWSAFAPDGVRLAANFYRDVIFKDPNWSVFDLDFDADVARARELHRDLLIKPDLQSFMKGGGKLILWHGWTDGVVSARSTIEYFEAVSNVVGTEATRENMRLFMVPGVNHCGGGDGTFSFDAVAALEQWVEQGRAPEHIIASRPLKGGSVRTRPLCPHPKVARYKGQGDTDDAVNFECRE
jgi:feruloyl esterase